MKKTIRKKRLYILLTEIFLVFILIGLAMFLALNIYVKMTAEKDFTTVNELKEEETSQVDAVLVLGAQVKADGSLSKMLKERLDTGIQIYKAGITDRIIMSGDHGSTDYDEVSAMKKYAIEQGVPSECIFMDHAGFSTYESMYRAKEIFEADNLVIVTQKYHLYRAIYDANAMGIDAKGVICDTKVYRGDKYRKFRESLARIKDVGYTIIKPEPTYLGKAIPVSGDGNVTND
ncbi:MAG: vancomycin high temperature exclusion protein [Lachnospiraceae bacterium]